MKKRKSKREARIKEYTKTKGKVFTSGMAAIPVLTARVKAYCLSSYWCKIPETMQT